MYDELVKKLRHCGNTISCLYCPYWDGCGGSKEDLTQAANAIEELSHDLDIMNAANIDLYGALPKWIAVTERLPDDLQNVLVIDDGRVTIGHCAHFYGDEQIYVEWHDTLYYPIDPPYWMPLPEPPKEKLA